MSIVARIVSVSELFWFCRYNKCSILII